MHFTQLPGRFITFAQGTYFCSNCWFQHQYLRSCVPFQWSCVHQLQKLRTLERYTCNADRENLLEKMWKRFSYNHSHWICFPRAQHHCMPPVNQWPFQAEMDADKDRKLCRYLLFTKMCSPTFFWELCLKLLFSSVIYRTGRVVNKLLTTFLLQARVPGSGCCVRVVFVLEPEVYGHSFFFSRSVVLPKILNTKNEKMGQKQVNLISPLGARIISAKVACHCIFCSVAVPFHFPMQIKKLTKSRHQEMALQKNGHNILFHCTIDQMMFSYSF